MGDIKNQRQVMAAALHHPEAEHVHHEVVVAEVAAPLADQQLFVAAFAKFLHHVRHLGWAEELGFFDVDHGPRAGHRLHQVGLSSQEGRELDDVAHGSGRCCFLWAVYVGDHRNAMGVFHRLQDLETVLQSRAPIGVDR